MGRLSGPWIRPGPDLHLHQHVFTTDDLVARDGKKIWTIQPATTVGATPSPEYFLASRYNCPGGTCTGDQIVVGRLDGSKFRSKLLDIKEVTMPTATQEGT